MPCYRSFIETGTKPMLAKSSLLLLSSCFPSFLPYIDQLLLYSSFLLLFAISSLSREKFYFRKQAFFKLFRCIFLLLSFFSEGRRISFSSFTTTNCNRNQYHTQLHVDSSIVDWTHCNWVNWIEHVAPLLCWLRRQMLLIIITWFVVDYKNNYNVNRCSCSSFNQLSKSLLRPI